MNFARLYGELTSPPPKDETLEQKHTRLEEEQRVAHLFQVEASDRLNWEESPTTKKYFLKLEAERDMAIEQAIALANTFHTHKDHQQIVSLLIKSHYINTQLNTHFYARRNTSA